MKRVNLVKVLAWVMAAAMIVSLPVKAAEQSYPAGAESVTEQTEESGNVQESADESGSREALAETGDKESLSENDQKETPAESDSTDPSVAEPSGDENASEASGEAGQTPAAEDAVTEEAPVGETDTGMPAETPDTTDAEEVSGEEGIGMDPAAAEAADGNISAEAETPDEVNMKKTVTVNAAVWQPAMEYNKTVCSAGGLKQAAVGLLMDGDTPLTEGVHYTADYKGNKKAGTAKVTFTGLGRYTGSFTKSFKITPAKLLQTTAPEKVIYTKGGVVPVVEVKDADGAVLTAGKEYTLKFVNNKKCGEAAYKVKGKGNFKGAAASGSFTVLPANIETDCRITVSDKLYKNKKNAYKAVPALYDEQNGKKLKAGVDYEKAILYQKKQGGTYVDIAAGEIPEAGSRIRVSVKGTGNYTGTAVADYRIIGESSDPAFTVVVKPGGLNMASGDTAQLTVSVPDAENNEWTVAFESEDTSVAAVDEKGLVKAVAKGITSVIATVTDTDGSTAVGSCKVFVDRNVVILEATPNDGQNDTDEFNAAIREVSEKNSGVSEEERTILWVPEGVYHIDVNDEYKKIEVKSNVTIMMDDNAVLQALPTSRSGYYMVWIAGAENVKFSGGKVIGDRSIHKGSGGADGHCIAVLESKNVTIDNVDVSYGWGDGIYVGIYNGTYGNADRYVKNVTITNCNVHNNRRNNIAITNGDNVAISNCTLKNHGTNEGLCIETNKNSVPVTNVNVENCEISGSVKEAMGVPRPAKNVRFTKCTFKGTAYNGGCGGLVFDSCTITGDLIEANHSNSSLYEHAKLINTTVRGEHIKY